MSGKVPHLRVGVVEDPPEAQGCFRQLPLGSCPHPGYEVEVFRTAVGLLGWDFEFLEAATYGYQTADGNWTGLLGMVHRNEVDVTAVTLRITEQRLQIADPSFPLYAVKQGFLVRLPSDFVHASIVFKPMKSVFLLYILLCLLVTVVVQSVVKVLVKNRSPSFGLLLESLWELVAVGMKQNHVRHRRASLEILNKTWLFVSFVGIVIYGSVLDSLLAVPPRSKVPFRTATELSQLIETGDYHLLGFVSSPPKCPKETVCEDSFQSGLRSNPIEIVKSDTELLGKIDSGPYTFCFTEDVDMMPAELLRTENQRLLIRDDSVEVELVAFMFQKRSKFRRKLSEALAVLNTFGRRVKHRYRIPYEPEYRDQRVELAAVGVYHLSELVYFFFFGHALALVAFLVEIGSKSLEILRARRKVSSELPIMDYSSDADVCDL